MDTTIRNIPINPTLSAARCREMVSRVRTVRQGATAEAWLEANRILSAKERDELMQALTLRIREAFHREAAEAGTGTHARETRRSRHRKAGG